MEYSGTTHSTKYVEEWLKRDTDASWEKLVSGLKRTGMNAMAKEVESAYISKGERATVVTSSPTPFTSGMPAPQQSLNSSAKLEAAPTTGASATAAVQPLAVINYCPVVNMERVAKVKTAKEEFEDTFFDIKFDAWVYLCVKESQDVNFLARFRDYLLDLSVSERIIRSLHTRMTLAMQKMSKRSLRSFATTAATSTMT